LGNIGGLIMRVSPSLRERHAVAASPDALSGLHSSLLVGESPAGSGWIVKLPARPYFMCKLMAVNVNGIRCAGRELLACAVIWLMSWGAIAQTPPSISVQPSSGNAFIGAPITFQVATTGTRPLTNQWQFNGLDIHGANSATFSIPFVRLADAGQYRVVVSNAFGSITSSNALLNAVGPMIEWGYQDAMATYPPPQSTNLTSIAASAWSDNFLALKNDGAIVSWGNNARGQTNLPAGLSNVVALSTGRYHSLAALRDGTVVAWGENAFGASDVPSGLTNVVAVAAGGGINYAEASFSMALEADGTVVVWGQISSPGVSNTVPGLTKVVGITAGNSHALALRSDGTVIAWGDNEIGQATVPSGLSNIVQVAAGGWFSLALRSDGNVFGWGEDFYGQTDVPTALSNVVAIAAGYYHSMALCQDGTVVCWGAGGAYNLGQATPPHGLTNIIAIAGAQGYSLALASEIVHNPTISHFSQSVLPGENGTFTAFAVGPGPLSFQWQFNGTNIPGATNLDLVLTNVPLSAAGAYQCNVSNALSDYTTWPAVLTVPRAPRFDISNSKFGLGLGGFKLSLRGLSAHGNIIILDSTNLVDWTPIFTNAPVLGTLQLQDPRATNLHSRFYRIIEQ
jgi:hypothetical protein